MKAFDPLTHDDRFLRELGALNAGITPEYVAVYRAYRPLTLAIVCSDARVPETWLLPGHSYFTMKTAGNVFDPQAELLPDSLQYCVVIGHQLENRAGCGACDAARQHHDDPGAVASSLAETPELAALIEQVDPDVWDNVRMVSQEVQRASVIDSARVYSMVYSHAEARAFVPEGMSGGRATEEIAQHTAAGRGGFGYFDVRAGELLDVRIGQQPRAIVLNTLSGHLGRAFGHFFPSLSRRHLLPNAVFEAKSPTSTVSGHLVGSVQYAFQQALAGGPRFSSTKNAFILTGSREQLDLIWGRLAGQPVVQGFLSRGGAVHGLVPDENLTVSFYEAD